MEYQSEIVEFFREVQRIITKHGLSKVIKQLRRMSLDCGDSYEKDICEFIISTTANHFDISRDLLLNSKKRGKISDARRMSFALMKEHLHFSDEQIGDYFGGRSRQYINYELVNLPLNQDRFATKDEARFVSDFIQLTTQVLHYKNSYLITKNNN